MVRRLFGVPDEIPDMTRSFGMVRRRRFIYGKSLFGRRKCSGVYRYCTGTTERVPGVHREGPPAPEGPMGCVWRGISPLVGWFAPFPWPMKPPNTCRGSRNTFRSCWSSPGTSGTLPDSKTLRPIYQSLPPDHSGAPRDVRDLIRDSEQHSVTAYILSL